MSSRLLPRELLAPANPAVWMSDTASTTSPRSPSANRGAGLLVVADDDGCVFRCFENLIVVVDLPAVLRVVEAALWAGWRWHRIALCERLQVRSRYCASCMRIEFDANRGLGAASNEDLADTLDLRDLLRQDRVCHVIDLGLGNDVGCERENQDWRVGWIGFAVARILRHVRRQLAAGTH